MDKAHIKTDKILEALEKDLNKIYKQAYFECKDKLKDNQKLIDKLNSENDLIKRNEMLRKKNRLDNLLKQIMLFVNSANEIATKMINDEMINVYYFNYAYIGYTIEKALNTRLGFQVFNQNAIKNLLLEEVNPFTLLAMDKLKDKSNVYMQFKRELATGLLLGENITDLAKRIEKVVGTNHNASVKIARTETTRVQNVSRMDSFKYAQDKGVEIEKEWISTIDKRTRKSHRGLMGQVRKLNEKFSNGLMYPGEPVDRPYEVMNCRCTMVSKIVGLKEGKKIKEVEENISKLSFEEWGDKYA